MSLVDVAAAFPILEEFRASPVVPGDGRDVLADAPPVPPPDVPAPGRAAVPHCSPARHGSDELRVAIHDAAGVDAGHAPSRRRSVAPAVQESRASSQAWETASTVRERLVTPGPDKQYVVAKGLPQDAAAHTPSATGPVPKRELFRFVRAAVANGGRHLNMRRDGRRATERLPGSCQTKPMPALALAAACSSGIASCSYATRSGCG